MSGKNPVWSFFHEHKLDFVLDANRDKGLVTLDSGKTLEDAVHTFSKHGILSAPVIDAKTSKIVGVIDLSDISTYFLTLFPGQSNGGAAAKLDNAMAQTIARTLHLRTVAEVMNCSSRNTFVVLNVHQPLTVAADFFSQGCHRAPIVDDTQNLVGLVSQSKLLELIAAHPHKSRFTLGSSIQSLQLGLPTTVVSTRRDSTVLDALKLMIDNGVTAIAVVDASGKLCGTFSTSDVGGLFSASVPPFSETVEDYLLQYSPQSLTSVCVRPASTLGDTMKLLVELKVHRVWVIDGNFKPTGVVAITDLFQFFKTYEASS